MTNETPKLINRIRGLLSLKEFHVIRESVFNKKSLRDVSSDLGLPVSETRRVMDEALAKLKEVRIDIKI